MKMYESNVKQIGLLHVKELGKKVSAKRVNIISLRMVKESSLVGHNHPSGQALNIVS